MKELVELLAKKGYLYKELAPLDPKALGIRRRWELFEGVDTEGRYHLIFRIERKSRFGTKDARSMILLGEFIAQKRGHAYAKKIAIIAAPLCSKAKRVLQEKGFRVVAL